MSSFLASYKFKVGCQLLHDPLSDSVAPDADGFHFKIRSTCQFFVRSLRREVVQVNVQNYFAAFINHYFFNCTKN